MHYNLIPETKPALSIDKIRASRRIRNRIANGSLVRGCCVVCGKEKTVGHHYDYSKPLEVYWLCHKHHLELHRNERKSVQEKTNEMV